MAHLLWHDFSNAELQPANQSLDIDWLRDELKSIGMKHHIADRKLRGQLMKYDGGCNSSETTLRRLKD
jgi:hypothetical protein